MEQKLGQEIEKKEETISDDKREKSVSEILDQGVILTMRDDMDFLRREDESISVEKKIKREEMLINMIKAKAGERVRIEEEKKRKKREELEKRGKELEKEHKEIEEIKTKAKQKEMEIITKKQKELAEEKERERDKEIEEQKTRMERSRIEEEKIIEDIRKRAVEEAGQRKERLINEESLEEKLKKERAEVKNKLEEILANKSPLEGEKTKLDGNKNMLRDILKDILKDEAGLEDKKRLIEKREAEITDPAEKHKVEKERWVIEKNIKEIEQQKWKQLEDIQKIEKQIKDIDIKFEEFKREEDRLKEIERKTINLQEKIKLEKEKEKINKEIELYHLQLAPLISEKIELETKNGQMNKELQDILVQEAEIERKVKVFKQKAQEASDLEEEKEIGEKIWGMGQERQIIEKNRWEKEKEIDKSMDKMKEIDLSYRKIFVEKEKLEATIIEINNLLKDVTLSPDGVKKEEIEKEQEIPEEPKIETTKPESFSAEKDEKDEKDELEQEQENIISEIKEKLLAEEKAKKAEEFSNKTSEQDKKTVVEKEGEEEQDIIGRRRQEIEKEKKIENEKQTILAKEKILRGLEKISPDEEKERKKFLDRIKDKQAEAAKLGFSQGERVFTLEKPEGEIIYRPLPKTQSSQEKILMRVLIFLLLISVVIAIYLLKSKYL